MAIVVKNNKENVWNKLMKSPCFVYLKYHGGMLIVALLTIAPILVYSCQFRNLEISDSPGDWGTFGDYVGGVYTVIVVILAVILSRVLEKEDYCKLQLFYYIIVTLKRSRITISTS